MCLEHSTTKGYVMEHSTITMITTNRCLKLIQQHLLLLRDHTQLTLKMHYNMLRIVYVVYCHI